LFHNQSQILS